MGDEETLDSDSRLLAESVWHGAAFTEFYRQNRDPLLRWLYRETHQAEVAADLMSETFAVALAKRHKFDPRKGNARAWLWGIAKIELRKWRRHESIDDRARRRLDVPVVAADDQAIAHIDSLLDAAAAVDNVRASLPSLPEGERDAVQLRLVDGLGYEEIALQLDCKPVAARVRVSRGLARLRSLLSGSDASP